MQQCETSGGQRGFKGEGEITYGVSYVILKLRSPGSLSTSLASFKDFLKHYDRIIPFKRNVKNNLAQQKLLVNGVKRLNELK